jgi:hypothetical protein
MKIVSAMVVKSAVADEILLQIDLPDPIHPFKGKAVLKMIAAYDTGESYVREHFDLEPEVIDRR